MPEKQIEIDLGSVTVQESFSNIINKLQNISYCPPEEVIAGALLAIREYTADCGLRFDAVTSALELAKWKHIDQFKCFHSTQDRYIKDFQVHCRECEQASQPAVGMET